MTSKRGGAPERRTALKPADRTVSVLPAELSDACRGGQVPWRRATTWVRRMRKQQLAGRRALPKNKRYSPLPGGFLVLTSSWATPM